MKSRLHDSIHVLWQVQVRKSRAHKWVNKGRFETRKDARTNAWMYREVNGGSGKPPYGFGNTRVVRVVVEHRPSKMLRPCAPKSYADPKAIHLPLVIRGKGGRK